MLNLQLKYIEKVLDKNGATKDLCDNLSYIFITNIANKCAAQKLIDLWNYTFFYYKEAYVLTLGRGEDYRQNCMVLLSDNIHYYLKLAGCEKFDSDDLFSKGSFCKASIAFFKGDILAIKNEIMELMDNEGFVEKEKQKLAKTMYCFIDILNDDEALFNEDIKYALMLDKQYLRDSGTKFALISTALLRLARYKNKNWSFDNELINQFLVERDFYSQTPNCWSKGYFKNELSQIVNLIK
jgi:hypothetical protein